MFMCVFLPSPRLAPALSYLQTSVGMMGLPRRSCGGFALLGGARLDAGLGGGGIGEQGAQAHQPGTEQDVSLQHGDYIIQSCIL